MKLHATVALLALVALVCLSGCTTSRYLAQAGCGQIDIMLRARDMTAVIRDPAVPARTRELLALVPEIKKFGERHSLRPTQSYHRYVDLQRSNVVWVVTAAEPLRFHSKTWSFPIVGAVPYLGWFDKGEAREFAAELRAEGWDVDVGGSEAYSTLGWFDDPVLSSMIAEGDEALGELVNVVLHESVHATLYIDGQTRFNESLAEFSADKFTVIYLDERYGAASEQKAAYEDAQRRSQERHAKFHRAYEELDRVYKSKDPDAVKLAHKKRILEALRAEVRARRHLTNATLAAFKNYNSATPEFGALLDACGGSWDRFFGSLGTLKKKGSSVKSNQADLAAVLDPLIKGGCAAP